MRRRPDHRWLAVSVAQVEPAHPIEGACWRHVRGVEACSATSRAVEIYEDEFERERLQPWIVAGAEDDDIQERVGLSTQATQAYRHMFFDMAVFRDRLELQRWVARYDGTPEGAAFLQKAVLHGLEAVAHVMGAPCKLDPQHVIESGMREAFYRAQALRSARLAGAEAGAAHQLLRTAIDNAQLMSRTRPASIGDIMLKLKTREMTWAVDDVALQGEVLH